jgi:hypothetical protein
MTVDLYVPDEATLSLKVTDIIPKDGFLMYQIETSVRRPHIFLNSTDYFGTFCKEKYESSKKV